MTTHLFARRTGTLLLHLSLVLALLGCQNQRQAVPPAPSNETFRFAVISDLHFGLSDAPDKVGRTLKVIMAKAPDIAALFVVGDLTDASTATAYDQLTELFSANVPSSVRVVYMMGERDRSTDTSGERFRSKTNQEPNQYFELGGYPFITISVDGTATNGATCYGAATKTFLEQKMAIAAQKHEGKPIFVCYHIPISGTIWGTSVPNNFASPTLEATMNSYTQAIAFSGHTHYPLGDERSILQRKFTAINTSSSSYGLLPYGIATAPENLYRPRGSAEVTEAMIVSVGPEHHVTIDRINTFNSSSIKKPWTIRAPHDGTQFTYTDTRRGGTPPAFAPGAALTVGNITLSGCTISFPQASSEDLVYSYYVQVTNQNTKKIEQALQLTSQFWNGSYMPASVSWNLAGLYSGCPYTVALWAEDSWGQRSLAGLQSAPFTTLK